MIDTCSMCREDRGWVEVLPADQFNHPTLARCPHSAMELVRIKRNAEDMRAVAATMRHRLADGRESRPVMTTSPPKLNES